MTGSRSRQQRYEREEVYPGSTGHRRRALTLLAMLTSLTMRWVVVSIALLGLLAVPRVLAQAPRVRPSFAVEIPQGNSLTSDGMGPYRDGEEGLIATGNFAVSLCTDQRTCTTYPEQEPADSAQRALILDLRSPVLSSNAKDRGTVRAAAANFGAFWGQDKTKRAVINGREGWIIRSVLDMKIGTTIQSERIEIRFFMNGAQHVLQFGPWTAGQYQTNQGGLTGDGSTPGTITRLSETSWRVQSGSDSLGRLWDNRDPAHPVDLGLYRFSYRAEFKRK